MIQAIGRDFFKGQEYTIYIVCARAAKDGELHRFDSGKTKGSVSVKAKEAADGTAMWVDISAWDESASIPASAKKGDGILAVGQLHGRKYNGKKYYDLNADYIGVAGNAAGSVFAPHSTVPQQSMPGNFEEVAEEDGELPF